MKKFIQNLTAGSIAVVFSLFMFSVGAAKVAKAAELPYVPGVMVGNVLTYTNTSDVAKSGFYPFYPTKSKIGAMVASENAMFFSCGEHVTWGPYKIGYKTYYKYIFDGYNITLNVPAHETVTVQESLTLPVTIPGIVCLK